MAAVEASPDAGRVKDAPLPLRTYVLNRLVHDREQGGARKVTWRSTGAGTIFLQVGSIQSEEEIEVRE